MRIWILEKGRGDKMKYNISDLMTAKEVAEKLGVSKPSVFYHGLRGNLTQVEAFGLILFTKNSVEKFCKGRS